MVVGKCEVCKKETEIVEHHIMPFWDDVIKVCRRCHRRIEKMTKNFLIYGMLKTSDFFNSLQLKRYREKIKSKSFGLGKSVEMQVRYNLNSGRVYLQFIYHYIYKRKCRGFSLGSVSF